jgi:protoporphyrinogen oxidase
LGGGVTGLSAGAVSDFPVFEAEERPGGICASYYLTRDGKPLNRAKASVTQSYRFEVGGGHWIFGGDSMLDSLFKSVGGRTSYRRRSSVFFPDRNVFVPYPVQYNLQYFGPELAGTILAEIVGGLGSRDDPKTLSDLFRSRFGQTLTDLFFEPFHHAYTAGLWKDIGPQDQYKTPLDIERIIQGTLGDTPPAGYNVRFVYPDRGLDHLASELARRGNVHYSKRVTGIDVDAKEVFFEDGSSQGYVELLSTLPLNKMMELTGIAVASPPDPNTSVLVLNIGAKRLSDTPSDHWVYISRSKAGFHRVGFYSNVDASFLPEANQDLVSIYVEKAYRAGDRPAPKDVEGVLRETINELQEWGWIGAVDVADSTWIDVAYTWSWADSNWTRQAIKALEIVGIHQAGRFARWSFQGIAESIREGFGAGSLLREALGASP